MTKALLYCAICVVFVGSALAYSGSDYLEACQKYLDNLLGTYQNGLYDGTCLGYTGGVIDTHENWQVFAERETFCLPDQAEVDQLIRVAMKYLEDHPAQLHYNAAYALQVALREAFPCTEGD